MQSAGTAFHSEPGNLRPRVRIVVPFYRNAHLVRPLIESIHAIADELTRNSASLSLYSDSADDAELDAELTRCCRDFKSLNIEIIKNPTNLGFLATVNRAFDKAIACNEDVVLLNSDTRVFPGALDEMIAVAYSDPMIGFVSPRSNNATICSLPHNEDSSAFTPERTCERYRYIAATLPAVSYVPTAVGFCLLVKGAILRELGGFDQIYGFGYNEENDLIMRANRLGYRAALANHAFVWHEGEVSFGKLPQARAAREASNAAILAKRYPEYPNLIHEYFSSPEYGAERILAGLIPDGNGRVTIGFDLSNVGTYHNGTFEAAKQLLFAAAGTWPANWRIVVRTSQASWNFHNFSACPRLEWVNLDDSAFVTAAVRIGQPFDAASLRNLLNWAPVVSIFMLDTIAADCGYLRLAFDHRLWNFTLRWCDLVFTNSTFTAEQLKRRYMVGESVRVVPTLHSLTLDDYYAGPTLPPPRSDDGLLVIGNKFAHKALSETVRALSQNLPRLKLTALGAEQPLQGCARSIPSGALSDEEMHDLFVRTEAIIFPSHYEGFGFPVLHALARRRPIYVRRLPPFEEMASQLSSGSENIHWYDTNADLVRLLSSGVAKWQGPSAIGEHHGWQRSANEVQQELAAAIARVSSTRLSDRLRWFDAAFAPASGVPLYMSDTDIASRLVVSTFDHHIRRAMQNKSLFALTRTSWRAYKRARSSVARVRNWLKP